MRSYRFLQLDVFTATPFGGNQLAVFTEAQELTPDEMQTLAREMNFAESAFVLPAELPGAVKRVRIFTIEHEMPFAGHPTIGATFALAHERVIAMEGAETYATLQLNIGLTPVWVVSRNGKPETTWMRQPAAEFGAPWPAAEAVARALGLAPEALDANYPLQIVSTGVPYLIVPLRSLEAVQNARPGGAMLREQLFRASAGLPVPLCAYLFSRETAAPGHTVHARMFDPSLLPEDAATGSAAGPLGAYLLKHGIIAPGKIVVEQGFEMKRPSLIEVEVTASGGIAIGGPSVVVGKGVMYLP